MKIQKNNICNKNVMQIYLSNQEKKEAYIQDKINQIKSKNKYVVIFISGDKDAKKSIKDMVTIMKLQQDGGSK